jgi:uncharacterized RDD family membrane protein YckC
MNLNYANFNSRAIGLIIDCLFWLIIPLALYLFTAHNSAGFPIFELSITLFFLEILYGVAYPFASRGKTIGRTIMATRLVDREGYDCTIGQLLKRFFIVRACPLIAWVFLVLASAKVADIPIINDLVITILIIFVLPPTVVAQSIFFILSFIVSPHKDPQKRTLHDKIADTVVVQEN